MRQVCQVIEYKFIRKGDEITREVGQIAHIVDELTREVRQVILLANELTREVRHAGQ